MTQKSEVQQTVALHNMCDLAFVSRHSADGPQTITEDIFIWSVGPTCSV